MRRSVLILGVLSLAAAGCGSGESAPTTAEPAFNPTKPPISESERIKEEKETKTAGGVVEAEEKQHAREREYPPQAKHEFLVGCKAGERSSSTCTCWLHKIEARESLAEFEAVSYALTHGAKVPEGLKEDLEACEG
jgi:hypothetical protein